MANYDYCIIGAGPTGIALSWYLSKYGKKVILIDSNEMIGGCHRVMRVTGSKGTQNLFSEHSPRIYSNNYNNFHHMLEDMGSDYKDIFSNYRYTPITIGISIILQLSIREIIILGMVFIWSLFFESKETMRELMIRYNFSFNGYNVIDRLCRLFESASAKRFTVYELFSLIDNTVFYSILIPKKPNDIGLFKIIKKQLKNNGVKIILNKKVKSLEYNSDENRIESVLLNNKKKIKANKIILAVPPKNILDIISNSPIPKIKNSFGNYKKFQRYVTKSNYLSYITVIFHWKKGTKIQSVWGYPTGDWGIIHINMSDYFENNDTVIISSTVSILDEPNKDFETAESFLRKFNEQEFADEVFRQMKKAYNNLPKYDEYVLVPRNDTAFVFTNAGSLGFDSKISNLFTVGTHNKKDNYSATTMESAIQNAIKFVHREIPETIDKIKIINSISISTLIWPIIYIVQMINSLLFNFLGKNKTY